MQNGACYILSHGVNFLKLHHCCFQLYSSCCHNLTGSAMSPFLLLRNATILYCKSCHLKKYGTTQMVKIISADGFEKCSVNEHNLSKLWESWGWNISLKCREKVCEVSETWVRCEPQHHVLKKDWFLG